MSLVIDSIDSIYSNYPHRGGIYFINLKMIMCLWRLYLSLSIIEVSHCQSWFEIWSTWQRERDQGESGYSKQSVSAQARLCIFFPSAWSCRSSGEAPADLPHLPPPAACGQPACLEGCRHHIGPLQETVHAERRSRSEEDHESCSAGMAEKTFLNVN